MPYIKIPDAQIIDLSAWQQVITVVNQHSDSIATLINDFGIQYEKVWDTDNYSVQYDAASQKILYGRALIKAADNKNGNVYTSNWHEAVSFSSPFSGIPVVTATILIGNNAAYNLANTKAKVSIYQLSSNGFSFRVTDPTDNDQTGYNIWVNWTAIGPR